MDVVPGPPGGLRNPHNRARVQKPILHNESTTITKSASGLVVKSIVAIDGPRVRFAAGAILLHFFLLHFSCLFSFSLFLLPATFVSTSFPTYLFQVVALLGPFFVAGLRYPITSFFIMEGNIENEHG